MSAMTPCTHPSLLVVPTDCKLGGAGAITHYISIGLWRISTSNHSTDGVPLECLFSGGFSNTYSSFFMTFLMP